MDLIINSLKSVSIAIIEPMHLLMIIIHQFSRKVHFILKILELYQSKKWH